MALITKICTVVWKSASSFQCVNQLPPPSLEQLFYPVIEVTAQAPKITACICLWHPFLSRREQCGNGHGLRFAGVPQVILNSNVFPGMRAVRDETGSRLKHLSLQVSASSKPWDFIPHVPPWQSAVQAPSPLHDA